jgi:hypothetical protein
VASVFISFAHEDEEIASALKHLIVEELEPEGAVFLSSDVKPGDQWIVKVREALESCEVILCLLSARSARRPWINFEAGAAWIQKRPVIPVCLGKMSKASLSQLPQPYSERQAVALPGQEDVLLKAVAEYLGKVWFPTTESRGAELIAQYTGEPLKRRSLWYKVLDTLTKGYKDA